MRLTILRIVLWLGMWGALTACTRAEALPAYLHAPVGLEAAQLYEAVCPITTPEQAARTALRLAIANGALLRAGAQRVMDVQQSSYANAYRSIYANNDTVAKTEAPDAPMWLITLEGLWQIAPPGARASYTARPTRVLVALKATGTCDLTLGFLAKEIVVREPD